MSLDELSTHRGDAVYKPIPSNLQIQSDYLFQIASKPPNERNPNDRKLLSEVLNQFDAIKHTFKEITDYRSYLLQCSNYIEACSFPKGTSILTHGDKCNEVFLVLSGSINTYDLKTSQEFSKQREVYTTGLTRYLTSKAKISSPTPTPSTTFNKPPPSIPTITLERKKTERRTSRMQSKENFSLEDVSIGPNSTERLPSLVNQQDEPTKSSGRWTSRSKMKIKSFVAFLKHKPEENPVKIEEKFDQHGHLPDEERLLLEDGVCKKKYFREGVCMLVFSGHINADEIINENCLLQEFRSPVTMVAREDVKCLKLSRQMFREVLREELIGIEEKKKFFLNIFHKVHQGSVVESMKYIREKKFLMHEKVYNQGDKSRGIFFIKEGEVKLHYTHMETLRESDYLSINATETDIFLPHQQKAIRRKQGIAGIISQGDFFGEEDLALNMATRKYTAVSASNNLILYYINSKQYNHLQRVCPEILKIIKARANKRNNWVDDNIKTAEAVREKAFQSLQGPQSPLKYEPNINFSHKNHPLLNKPKEPLSAQHGGKHAPPVNNLKHVLLLKTEDLQGNIPGHFKIVRDKDFVDLDAEKILGQYPMTHREHQEYLKLKEFATPKGKQRKKTLLPAYKEKQEKLKEEGKEEVRKLMEQSPSYRIYKQHKELHARGFPAPDANAREKTMSGLAKHQAELHTVRTLMSSHLTAHKTPSLSLKNHPLMLNQLSMLSPTGSSLGIRNSSLPDSAIVLKEMPSNSSAGGALSPKNQTPILIKNEVAKGSFRRSPNHVNIRVGTSSHFLSTRGPGFKISHRKAQNKSCTNHFFTNESTEEQTTNESIKVESALQPHYINTTDMNGLGKWSDFEDNISPLSLGSGSKQLFSPEIKRAPKPSLSFVSPRSDFYGFRTGETEPYDSGRSQGGLSATAILGKSRRKLIKAGGFLQSKFIKS